MYVVPVAVGEAARAWDEQHHDLTAAADQIGCAAPAVFTDRVSAAASRFSTTWRWHTTALAAQAETRADRLRAAVADLLETDEAVGFEVLGLRRFLVEER